jgi:hypothetical protein
MENFSVGVFGVGNIFFLWKIWSGFLADYCLIELRRFLLSPAYYSVSCLEDSRRLFPETINDLAILNLKTPNLKKIKSAGKFS